MLRLLSLAVALLAARSLCAAEPTFARAVHAGNEVATEQMLAAGADVNAPEEDGTTALHWAVHQARPALVQRLIAAGANVRAPNAYGATPMSEAAIVGNVDILRALLKAGADVESPNAESQTALMMIARTSNVDAARLLIAHGANVNARERWRGHTALMWAAAESQPAMVRELLRHGARVDERSQVNHWERQVTAEPRFQARPAGGLTALLFAARAGCVPCVQALVERGANVDLADPDGVTPLLVALLNLNFDTASYLLARGADVNRWDRWGRTALYVAVDMNAVPHGGRRDQPSLDATTGLQLIERLLQAGANPNAQLKLFPPYRAQGPDRGADTILTVGATPLLRAARGADLEAMRLLLKHGADVNLPTGAVNMYLGIRDTLKDIVGVTPVMAAAGLGSSRRDTRGRFRIEQEALASLELLVSAGADVNARNAAGQTALYGAAYWGWNDVIRYLVDHQAKLDVTDGQGKTPLDASLGKAPQPGGGQTAQVHSETAALIRSLLGE